MPDCIEEHIDDKLTTYLTEMNGNDKDENTPELTPEQARAAVVDLKARKD